MLKVNYTYASERERERERNSYVIKINYYNEDIAQNARSSTMTGSLLTRAREKKASAIRKEIKKKGKRISRLRLPIKNTSPHEYIIVIGSTFYTCDPNDSRRVILRLYPAPVAAPSCR